MVKYCKKCDVETERYKAGRCKICHRIDLAKYHKKNSRYYLEYFKRNHAKWIKLIRSLYMDTCSVCGYGDCGAAVEQHHLNEDRKSFIISSFLGNPFTLKNKIKLLNELRKCTPLCKVCHAELHAEYGIFEPRSGPGSA